MSCRFFIAAILVGITTGLCAQDVHNGTTIHVSDGNLIHLPASFFNEGYLENNGRIAVAGDWTNLNIYNGIGTIQLYGSQVQHFIHNNQPIENLEISGGNFKRLEDHVLINKDLTLNQGIIQFVGQGSLQLAATSSIIGGSEESYVDGPLTQMGVGYKFFPIGKDGMYRPFELLNITGITPTVSMELVLQVPEDIVTDGDEQVFRSYYWKRETNAGDFFSSPVSATYASDDVNASDNIVIIQSKNFEESFTALTTERITGHGRLNNIISVDAAEGNIFMLASPPSPPEIKEPEYYFSSTLSPNATNPNNRFIKVFGDFLVEQNFHFAIFNRQGLMVFETSSLSQMKDNGWSGVASNGSVLGSGAYPFTFQATSIKGKMISQKGIITLIR